MYFRAVLRWRRGLESYWPLLEGWKRGNRLPWLIPALQHDLTSISVAIMLMLAAVVLGSRITRLLRWESEYASEWFAMCGALGIGAFATLGLGLALFGWYRPWVLFGVASAVLAWWLGLVAWRNQPGVNPRLRRPRMKHVPWMACAILLLGVTLFFALAPEREYDALWYHLFFPRLALAQGHLVDVPTEYVSLYPMTWELWFGYGLALGGEQTAVLLHFGALILTLAAVYGLARRVAPGMSPWLPVALLASLPIVQWDASTAYTDVALALHVTLMVGALLAYIGSGARGALLAAALNLGLGLGTKHVAILVAVLAAPWLAVQLWRKQRSLLAALRPVLLLALVSLGPPLIWYARAYWLGGDPLSPQLYSLLGAVGDRWDDTANEALARFMGQFGQPRTLRNLLLLPWDATMHGAHYAGTVGPLLLALIPGLLLRPAQPAKASGLRAIAVFAFGFLALWALPLASFQLRWLIPVTPLFALLAAAGVTRLGAAMAWPPRILLWLFLAGVLGLQLPAFTPLHEGDRREWQGWLANTRRAIPMVVVGSETAATYRQREVHTANAWAWADAHLPPGAVVLAYAGGDHFLGVQGRLNALAPALRDLWTADDDESDVIARIDSLGITYLFREMRFLENNGFPDEQTWESFMLTRASTLQTYFQRVYDDPQVEIWERTVVRDTAAVARDTVPQPPGH